MNVTLVVLIVSSPLLPVPPFVVFTTFSIPQIVDPDPIHCILITSEIVSRKFPKHDIVPAISTSTPQGNCV